MPNWKKVIVSGSDAALSSLNVTGAVTSSAILADGTTDVIRIIGSGSTANTTLFSIDGNNGRLFEVSDDLSDSLFSVNTIAGLPVVEVFSDNRVIMGAFNQNDFVISGSRVGIGTATPGYKLHVVGNTKIDDDVYFFNTVLNPASNFANQRGAGFDASSGKFEIAASEIPLEISRFSTTGPVLSVRHSGSQVSSLGTDGGAHFSGNVGIGDTSPTRELTVNGDIGVKNGGRLYLWDSHNNNYIQYDKWTTSASSGMTITNQASTGNLSLQTISNTRLFISASGNVGIGTTSPDAQFEVQTIDSNRYVKFKAPNGEERFQFYTGGTGNPAAQHMYDADGTTRNVQIAAGGTSFFNGGNVGIGTSSPSAELTVQGSIHLSSSLPQLRFSDLQQEDWQISNDNGDFRFTQLDDNITAMYISASGNVGIGTTSPTATFTVVGNQLFDGTGINLKRTGILSGRTWNLGVDSNGLSVYDIDSSSYRLTIDETGNVGIGTTNPSDKLDVHGIIALNSVAFISQSGITGFIGDIDGTDAIGNLDINAADGTTRIFLDDGGHVGINTDTPNYSLDIALDSTSDRFNITRGGSVKLYVDGNGQVVSYANLVSYGNALSGGGGMFQYAGGTTGATVGHRFKHLNNSFSNSSGDQTMVEILPSVSQSATAGYTGLKVNVSETSIGSGTNNLLDLQVDGVSKYAVDRDGDVTIGGDLTVEGIVTAQEFHTEFVSASIIYESGSTKFGDTSDDLHDFTGSLRVLGDLKVDEGLTMNVNSGQGELGMLYDSQRLFLYGGSNRTTTNGAYIQLDGNNFGGTNAGGDLKLYAGNESGADIVFNTGATDRVVITNGGDVGIGITAPASTLHIKEDTSTVYDATAYQKDFIIERKNTSGNNQSAHIRFLVTGYEGQTTGEASIGVIQTSNASSGHTVFTNRHNGTRSETLRIQSDGNVGIGTTSPTQKLTVEDTIGIKRAGVAAVATIQQTGTGTEINAPSGYHPLIIKHNGSELARFKNDGNVGIGTTTPQLKLHLSGSTGAGSGIRQSRAGVRIWDQQIDSSGRLIWSHYASEGGTANQLLTLDDSNNVGIGEASPSAKLHVSGTSDVLLVEGSGSTIFDVQGSQGQLFSVTDSLVGSLFSVNDISGLPIVEVFDTDKVVMGTFGQNTLVVTGSNVGINTATPNEKLEVAGNIRLQNSGRVYLWQNNNNNYIDYANWIASTGNSQVIQNTGNGGITFKTLTNTRMFISSSGNVGIGTTSPAQKLHVNDGGIRVEKYATGLGGFISVGNGTEVAGNYSAYFFGNTNQDNAYFKGGIAYETLSSTNGRGDMHFLQNSEANGTNADISDSVMTILNSGNVGIGTTSPTHQLHISGGNVLIETDSGAELNLKNTSSGVQWQVVSGYNGGFEIGDVTNSRTDSSAPFFISSGAQVGIGTTSPSANVHISGSNPSLKIQDGNTGTLVLNADYASSGNDLIESDTNNLRISAAGGSKYISLWTAGSEKVRLNSNGTVGIGTTSPTQKLEVRDGNLVVSSSNSEVVIGTSSGKPRMQSNGNQDLLFSTANQTNVLYLQDANGRVGIGTTSPTKKLTVEGAISASSGFYGDGSNLTGITTSDGLADILENSNSAGSFSIDMNTNGIRGVGEIQADVFNGQSASLAHVTSSAGIRVQTRLGIQKDPHSTYAIDVNGSVNASSEFRAPYVKTNQINNRPNGNAAITFASDDDITFYSASSAIAVFSGGNLGVGTTSPAAQLEIRSDGGAAGGAEIRLQHANNNSTDVVSTVNFANNVGSVAMIQGGTTGANNTGYISFFTDNAGTSSEKMRILGNGNIGINESAPSYKLHVAGTFRASGNSSIGGDLTVTGALNATASYATNLVNIPALAEVLNSGEDGGGSNILDIGNIEASGTVTAGSFVETSARRFKENIEPISNSLEILSKVEGITFNRIGGERREYGFIADDILDVAPELVSHDENGEVQGVHYARTVAILTEAIKELDNKVKAQDLFIKDLVARIEKLENK